MDRRTFLKSTTALGAVAVTGLPTIARAEPDPFVRLDATAQAALVRTGEVTPLELTDAAIKRIETLNPKLNAVIHTMFDDAREKAKGELPDGPFKGVPYLIKDLSDLEGEPTTFGSRLFATNVADADAGAVERAKESGVVILGKTNTPEFGLLSTTESDLLGPAKNPWDIAKHTGGSSGGAGGAVASGMVPFAHASDGGGSIRIPASCGGLVGLKPSRGRLYTNKPPRTPADISVELTVSRSVRDTAQMLNVSERKGDDKLFDPVGFVDGPSTKRLKIGFTTQNFMNKDAAPDVKAALDATAALCAELGHTVEETPQPLNGDEFLDHFMTIWAEGAHQLVENAWIVGLMQFRWVTAKTGLEEWTRGLADYFQQKTAAKPDAVDQALAYFKNMGDFYDPLFSKCDVFLTPTLRRSPLDLGEQAPSVDFETLFQSVTDYASYTPQYNAFGNPAISLPLFTGAGSIPIGSQFAAPHGQEGRLLALAYELEAARPWADRWPTVSALNM